MSLETFTIMTLRNLNFINNTEYAKLNAAGVVSIQLNHDISSFGKAVYNVNFINGKTLHIAVETKEIAFGFVYALFKDKLFSYLETNF